MLIIQCTPKSPSTCVTKTNAKNNDWNKEVFYPSHIFLKLTNMSSLKPASREKSSPGAIWMLVSVMWMMVFP